MRILLVEDDEIIGEAVRDHTNTAGYATDWVRTVVDAEAASRSFEYGLVLLDLHLPDGNGLVFLEYFRARGGEAPVIVLTAKDQISDRIAGLNAGADDYLIKPFNLDELEARILAVRRRYEGRRRNTIEVADIVIERSSHSISVGGQDVQLTPREWALLDLLVERPGKLVTLKRIEDALYAFGEEVESNTVQVYISRLRKKIGMEKIRTARGLGYMLAVE
ncbi:response regulator (plasmid) [Sinorhizobium sp. B11]|uniref:response regulator n=1 Tax=unclassified Rhizobium TaxID=2613769 RepID=UPI000DDA959A|nr:response regulator [Rhizobium sp. BK512]MBB3443609.1 two-component system OmpR family response regulator [Rhizobium sp. BK379]MBB3562493.1 two-component system OmpR family response regulator [Rhizobium sp. BK512]